MLHLLPIISSRKIFIHPCVQPKILVTRPPPEARLGKIVEEQRPDKKSSKWEIVGTL